MDSTLTAIITGAITFAATNIDDIFVFGNIGLSGDNMSEPLKNLDALSVEERRLAEVFAVNSSDAEDLDQFLTANPELSDAESLASMVRLGAFIDGDNKSNSRAAA
jgi:hypothetical protein